MPSLNRRFNFGAKEKEQNPDLYNQMSDMYEDISGVTNTKASKRVIADQDPPANNQVNSNYDIGDLWVRTGTDTAWIMTSRTTANIAVWTQIT